MNDEKQCEHLIMYNHPSGGADAMSGGGVPVCADCGKSFFVITKNGGNGLVLTRRSNIEELIRLREIIKQQNLK